MKIQLHKAAFDLGEFSDSYEERQEYYYIIFKDSKDSSILRLATGKCCQLRAGPTYERGQSSVALWPWRENAGNRRRRPSSPVPADLPSGLALPAPARPAGPGFCPGCPRRGGGPPPRAGRPRCPGGSRAPPGPAPAPEVSGELQSPVMTTPSSGAAAAAAFSAAPVRPAPGGTRPGVRGAFTRPPLCRGRLSGSRGRARGGRFCPLPVRLPGGLAPLHGSACAFPSPARRGGLGEADPDPPDPERSAFSWRLQRRTGPRGPSGLGEECRLPGRRPLDRVSQAGAEPLSRPLPGAPGTRGGECSVGCWAAPGESLRPKPQRSIEAAEGRSPLTPPPWFH
ncbi:translation initiation factor IF-2-like [Physeter macrocephalus]|uniref:Translation initiation factor IF-2-like n=1 Tax=Physeter macrocephalus TaxID=9755 RepID=A0A2Y9SNF6_PHYMC|nr:translation initiation factor IF-2-like [Physeter catodon]|eukprot:XP_023979848.1 uncharacterized protein LOC112064951 [Physeter catodon]